MRSDRSILIACVLNLLFSILEGVGGWMSGSAAILSDAVHDFTDALGLGLCWVMETVSRRKPNTTYTYGYARYSVLSGIVVCGALVIGSGLVIAHAVERLFHPLPLHYTGMIVLSLIGIAVNLAAALFTKHGHSSGEKAAHLHVLEDVWGWIVVLIGAVIAQIMNISWIDPVLSIVLAIVMGYKAIRRLCTDIPILLDRAPRGIDTAAVHRKLCALANVVDVHHLHIRSLDGIEHEATMHVVCDGDIAAVKRAVRETMAHFGITHVTIETERVSDGCQERTCIAVHHHTP